MEGLEQVPARGPVILVANHISYIDPLCLAYVGHQRGRRVRFMAMAELFRYPLLGPLLRRLGHIPVHRGTADAGTSLTAALAALDAGRCVGIFPEGGISRDLNPRSGRTGVARLAQSSGAPVVPVGLWGAHRLLTPGRPPRWRPGVAQVASVGPPVRISSEENVGVAVDRVMAAICAQVTRARASYPQPAARGEGHDPWWWRAPDAAVVRSHRDVAS
jgi:1-acyl-sn-glycerol-3-phosphate acyltransferase